MALPNHLIYLAGDGIHIAFAGLFFLRYKAERRAMLIGAALLIPPTFVVAPFAHDYWAPAYLVGSSFGLEDFLFSAAFSVIAWGMMRAFAAPLPRLDPFQPRFLLRSSVGFLIGAAVFFAMWSADFPFGVTHAACQGMIGLLLLALRPNLIRPALLTALGLSAYYLVALALMTHLFGGALAGFWSEGRVLGPTWAGIPVEDLIWSFTFGLSWVPLLIWSSEKRPARQA